MLTWLRGKITASTAQAAQNEDPPPPQMRKPQHAYRDARMSIPVAEREFYETIMARRKRSSAASSIWTGKGKGKGRAMDSGYASYRSTPASSQPASHNSSCASATDLAGAWAAAVVAECCEREEDGDGDGLGSVAESSKDAEARGGSKEA